MLILMILYIFFTFLFSKINYKTFTINQDKNYNKYGLAVKKKNTDLLWDTYVPSVP